MTRHSPLVPSDMFSSNRMPMVTVRVNRQLPPGISSWLQLYQNIDPGIKNDHREKVMYEFQVEVYLSSYNESHVEHRVVEMTVGEIANLAVNEIIKEIPAPEDLSKMIQHAHSYDAVTMGGSMMNRMDMFLTKLYGLIYGGRNNNRWRIEKDPHGYLHRRANP